MAVAKQTVEHVEALERYQHGFVTDIAQDFAPKGLNEDTIRFISAKKDEPEWMLKLRLEAYERWLALEEPTWARVNFPRIDYQDSYYYAAPKQKVGPTSLDEVDPELLEVYAKLGIPLKEQEVLAGVQGAPKYAVDAVFDSVSVVTTFKAELAKVGVIFCSMSEAIRDHGDLVRQYLSSVVPVSDNYFACLNSAVFSDGSFVYVPPGVRCPMELSTYFRINAAESGQFERTLIIADKGAYVSYLEGCTAPMRDENQLHAAVVELVVLDDAEIKYSTVQNWYPGDKDGKGGIYNFVTKRADCRGARSKVSWTQVETGSAITWKYPSCVLRGEGSSGEFYSIAITNNRQQADTGTKMIHLGANTRSRIISKGISAGRSSNTYRGLVSAHPKAKGARNFTQCDSLLIGKECAANTTPYIEARNGSARFEHEATTTRLSEDQLFYVMQRGLSQEEAVQLLVNGFVKDVLQELPMEFAVEAQKLVAISLEGERGVSDPIVSGGGTGDSSNEPWFYFVRYGASTRAYPANWKGTVFLVGSILTVVVCALGAGLLWQFTGQVGWFIGFFLTIFPAFFIALFAVIRVKGQQVGGLTGYGGLADARSLAALQRRVPPNTLVQAVDHVQMAIPPGGEDQARPFYKDLLGLAEQPKPPELAARGGAWFDNGVVKVHLGVEDPFNPAEKAHPAFRVNDVSGLAAQARAAGYRVKDDEALPGYQRIYIYDPFGNRLEFLKPN